VVGHRLYTTDFQTLLLPFLGSLQESLVTNHSHRDCIRLPIINTGQPFRNRESECETGSEASRQEGEEKKEEEESAPYVAWPTIVHVGTILFIPVAVDLVFLGEVLPSWLFRALFTSFATLMVTGLIVYYLGGGDVDAHCGILDQLTRLTHYSASNGHGYGCPGRPQPIMMKNERWISFLQHP